MKYGTLRYDTVEMQISVEGTVKQRRLTRLEKPCRIDHSKHTVTLCEPKLYFNNSYETFDLSNALCFILTNFNALK